MTVVMKKEPETRLIEAQVLPILYYLWTSACVYMRIAWLWGPCQKCGIHRLTQPIGNYLEWNANTGAGRALQFDDEFEGSNMKRFLETL
jgi:hypothetical protein